MINSYAYKPLVYLRYIDDIFMIWTEGEENLNGFLSHCNQINKNIQFEQVASKDKIPFLDVSVINENGKLHTDLYSKPTDKHQNLYSHSCHPKHTKNSLPYCLALRLRRICSKKTYFNQRAKEMEHHLLQRGYTKGCIRDAITKASSISREDALVDKTNDNQLTRVPFVVTYNPKLPSLPKILKESQSILHSSERCSTVFPEVPLVSYRRSRNLSDMLCSKRLAPNPTTKPNRDNDSSSSNHHHSNKSTDPNKDNKSDESNNGNECPECGRTFRNPKGLQVHRSSKHNGKQNTPTSAGFWPCCSDKRCDICKQGKFCTSVSSTKNQKKHQIKQPVTCKTKNVCYLTNCAKCYDQYIGETSLQFHERMNNPKSDIRTNKKSNGTVRHFSKCGIQNLKQQYSRKFILGIPTSVRKENSTILNY